jgi:hypothetical protein
MCQKIRCNGDFLGTKQDLQDQSVSHLYLFTCTSKPKIFQNFSLYRIFRHMHKVLNIDENKTNYTVWSEFTRQIF